MTTTNLTYRKCNWTLTGNELTGNTYPHRDWIKSALGGNWDATRKVWIVDVNKVNIWISKYVISASAPVINNSHHVHGIDGWCDKCHSYCYGDCKFSG